MTNGFAKKTQKAPKEDGKRDFIERPMKGEDI